MRGKVVEGRKGKSYVGGNDKDDGEKTL